MQQNIHTLLLFFAIGFFCIGLSHAEDAEEPSVKVMSYNIYRGGTMHEQPLSQVF